MEYFFIVNYGVILCIALNRYAYMKLNTFLFLSFIFITLSSESFQLKLLYRSSAEVE